MNPADRRVRRRFFVLSLLRLTGAISCAVGLGILSGQPELPRAIGVVLTIGGALIFSVLPLVLATRWKSREEQ